MQNTGGKKGSILISLIFIRKGAHHFFSMRTNFLRMGKHDSIFETIYSVHYFSRLNLVCKKIKSACID